jgi:hypothetical protein
MDKEQKIIDDLMYQLQRKQTEVDVLVKHTGQQRRRIKAALMELIYLRTYPNGPKLDVADIRRIREIEQGLLPGLFP